MGSTMWIPAVRRACVAALAAVALVGAAYGQATPARPDEVPGAATAPAPGAAPAAAAPATIAPDPQPGDSNAQRTKSQPGNNAPFWRGVRESGTTPGVTNLPGAEPGVLIQEMPE